MESLLCTHPLLRLRLTHPICSSLIIALLHRIDLLQAQMIIYRLRINTCKLVCPEYTSFTTHILIPHLLQLVISLKGLVFLKSCRKTSQSDGLRCSEYMIRLNGIAIILLISLYGKDHLGNSWSSRNAARYGVIGSENSLQTVSDQLIVGLILILKRH